MQTLALERTTGFMSRPTRETVHLRAVPAPAPSCDGCRSLAVCMPSRGDNEPRSGFDQAVARRLRIRKGEVLAHSGDRFEGLYAIRSGSCKSVVTTTGGQEQLAGYHIAGDLVGIGAIFAGRHDSTVTALEDSEFCVIPMERLEALARQDAEFQHAVSALMSREIARERKVMLMLGAMRAEQRLASFLLDLAERYAARGYSSRAFVLRLTREEIGTHLGLKLETVSRLFSRFHRDGLIHVQGRDVKLLDRDGLQELVDAADAKRH